MSEALPGHNPHLEDAAERTSAHQPPGNPKANQHDRFIETARQLECDEDKERFEAKLKRIAKARPLATDAQKKFE